ncbi:MAG: serine hydrolase [Prolixibacteraceae bacterium]|jgi:CubicO group peptidase (beta-lactamase class C family)|nr:serine hydrolase [Prolixibacteraceae bacterium]
MKINTIYFLLIAAIFVNINVSAQKAVTPQKFNQKVNVSELGIKANNVKSLDSLLQAFIDNKKMNCVAAFVAQGGNVVYKKAFGMKDIENQISATVDDYYILFSQTKAITTVAFMTLVEKGLVSIDDPVSKYFPEIPNVVVTKVNEDGTYETRPATVPMTFVHLMSHSSGLNAGLVGEIRKAERKKSDASTEPGMPKKDTNGQRSGDDDKVARYLKDGMLNLVKYPLGFDPGTEYSYHISTNMLAYMIERISGKTLREYVKETVLIPLGMNETDWYYEPDALPRFVKAYNSVDGKLEPVSPFFREAAVSKVQTYCGGASGLNGPIEDYAKFCQMLLNKGEFNGHRILKAETIELMTTINRLPEKNAGGEGFQFGLGFELYNEQRKPTPEVSNTAYAWGGMWGTMYIIDPTNNMIALYYINMSQKEWVYPDFLSKAYGLFSN